MSLFGRLKGILGGDPAEPPTQPPTATLEERLAALDSRAEATPSMHRALTFNQAGDLCASEGDTDQALRYYGEAIDAYIDAGFFDSAAVVCRKVIDLSPSVVRAHCTLAFLSLGKGLLYLPFEELAADAHREIGHYVQAAQRQGLEDLAIKRLHMMAEVTDSHEIREMIGEHLMELGDNVGANEVLGVVFAERNHVRERPAENQRERWASALRVSIVGPPSPPREQSVKDAEAKVEVADDSGKGTAEEVEGGG